MEIILGTISHDENRITLEKLRASLHSNTLSAV